MGARAARHQLTVFSAGVWHNIVLAEVISHPQQGLCISDSIIKNLEVVNQTGSDLCFKNVIKNSQSCPPIRKLITEAKPSFCPCSDQSECWTPEISTNHSKLVIIQRQDKLEYLYLGNPAFIYMDTVLSDYHPHYSWTPVLLPDIIITLLLYTAAFSGGLAVLNVVPSYLLDGQHIVRVLADLLMQQSSEITKLNLVIFLTISGTFLLVSNIVL